jgi:hypothetical protein
MERRIRDRNDSPLKNKLIQDSEGNAAMDTQFQTPTKQR